jgi:hypothetical protein
LTKEEAAALIEVVVGELKNQYVLPLTFALATLTVAVCHRDKELSEAVSEILKAQGEDCLKNKAAGGVLLKQLANVASELPASAEDARNALRHSLRIVYGGKHNRDRSQEDLGGSDN